MVWLPDGEKISKISLFVLAQLTNVTDRQTDGHRVTAYTALMHMHRAVMNSRSRMDIIYLDYAKAFDSVVHNKVMAKLACYGINNMLYLD